MLDRYKSVDITDVLGFANRIAGRLEINMQKLRMYTHLLSILLTISIVLNVYPMLNVAADTDVKSEDVSPTLFQSGEQYDCTSSTKVDSMLFGRKTMGSFTINGEISDISSFDGRKAFGLAHGQLSFDYNCPSAFTDPNLNYYITNDSETKVSTINLDASIGQGVIIVQKSQDGKKWNTVNAITDFFGGHSKGQKAIYTTSGEDTNKGCYYRVIVRKDGTELWRIYHLTYSHCREKEGFPRRWDFKSGQKAAEYIINQYVEENESCGLKL